MARAEMTERWTDPIADRIAALRRRLTSAVRIRGAGRVAAFAIGLFVVDLGLDRWLRFDRSQRLVMLLLLVAALVWAIRRWLVLPMRERVSDDGLCLELEKASSVGRNALISAWQFSRGDASERQGVSSSLVEATLRMGGTAAQQVDLDRLIDRRKASTDLAVLVGSAVVIVAIGVGAFVFDPLRIWLDRNLLLGNRSWPQRTYLIVEGLDAEGRLPVVRGEDHKLIVRIDERSVEKDVEVFFDYRDAGSRYRQKLRRFEEDGNVRFEHLFGTVVSEFRFQVFGGDARNEWIQVRLVEPPGFESIELIATPPAYTGLKPETLERGRSPYDLLQGSRLTIRGRANKPLREATLRGPSGDRPFALAAGLDATLELGADELVEGKYVFDFVDEQGLTTRHPPSFAVRLIADRAPRIRAQTQGIGGLVVPRARVPLRISFEDDFAVVDGRLKWSWKGEQADSIGQNGEQVLEEIGPLVPAAKVDLTTAWELESLGIPEGASLVFSVAAHDNLSGTPNDGESKTFLLRVVSEAELRTDLLRREREQREAFERQITEQQELTVELRALAADLRRRAAGDQEVTVDPVDVLLSARRKQRTIATALLKVADAFESMLIEAENNRLDEESGRLRQRLAGQIVEPIRDLDVEEIETADRSLDAARVASASADLPERVDGVVRTQEEIAEKLAVILGAMVKAEGYQEAINLLREIERTQQRVLEQTDEERRRRIRSIFEGEEGGN